MTALQASAAIRIVHALAEAIRELGTIPSGTLYAQVMGRMDLDTYNGAIRCLKGAGLVEERQNELRWIGPKFAAEGITS